MAATRSRRRKKSRKPGRIAGVELGALGLGDLVRALEILAPRDDSSRRAIAGFIGYQLTTEDRLAPIGRTEGAVSGKVDRQPLLPQEPPRPRASEPDDTEERSFRLARDPASTASPRASVIVRVTASPLPAGVPEHRLPPPPHESLFNPRWSRAIVSSLARRVSGYGPPDIERLVERAAEHRPTFKLPLKLVETASALDILIDLDDGMTVFHRDQQEIVQLVRRVAGTAQVSRYRFHRTPGDGVLSVGAATRRPYIPIPAGGVILLLTDFGIGARGPGPPPEPLSDAWNAFVRPLRASGNRLIALCPYPQSRWPLGLSAQMEVVQWDRATGVRALRRLLSLAFRARR